MTLTIANVEIASPGDANPEVRRAVTMQGTAHADVSGRMVYVGRALGDEDIPPEGLEGKVALIERGDATFEEKVQSSQGSGSSRSGHLQQRAQLDLRLVAELVEHPSGCRKPRHWSRPG